MPLPSLPRWPALLGASFISCTTVGLHILLQLLGINALTWGILGELSSSFVVTWLIAQWMLGRIYAREQWWQEQSLTDPLTSLGNRRYFDDRLEGEIKRCQRTHANLGLLLIDVDRFKQINDTFGHPHGDTVLRHLAEGMRYICRGSDVICRLGGDEFAILAPSTSSSQAYELAQRLRQHIICMAPMDLPFSVSIGICDLHTSGYADRDILFRHADTALYTAKKQGRGQISLHRLPKDDQTSSSAESSPLFEQAYDPEDGVSPH